MSMIYPDAVAFKDTPSPLSEIAEFQMAPRYLNHGKSMYYSDATSVCNVTTTLARHRHM
jgi:hypothetical protein